MTEREQYLEHRIPVLKSMLRGLETERQELRRKRNGLEISEYIDRLETSCNPSREWIR